MITETIAQLTSALDVAKALGAPTFGVHDMLATAQEIERRINQESSATTGSLLVDDSLYVDLSTLKAGGEAAAAYITCIILPVELAAYRTEERGADAIKAANKIVKKYAN